MPLFLFLLVILISTQPAMGVEGKKMSRAALADEADSVVIGRVVNVETRVIQGEPWTIATVSSERSLKGRTGATVRLRIPGGQQNIGGRTLVTQVEGAPVFRINQKALFFLNRSDQEYHALTGLGRGYWRIETRDGKEVVAPASGDESSDRIPLDAFLSEVSWGLKERRQR